MKISILFSAILSALVIGVPVYAQTQNTNSFNKADIKTTSIVPISFTQNNG
jgi:hypothetical protein